jgi:hypothetical protein
VILIGLGGLVLARNKKQQNPTDPSVPTMTKTPHPQLQFNSIPHAPCAFITIFFVFCEFEFELKGSNV